jgi:tetratricopeptide (TPR) repeat protein
VPPEAVALLERLAPAPVRADPGAAEALAEVCARLPLALRIAAEFAAAHPGRPLREFVAELEAGRLDRLAAPGDERTALRPVFSWSHRHLGPAAERAFALLGVHPGRSYDRYALAALAGTSPDDAGAALAELGRAHLLEAVGGASATGARPIEVRPIELWPIEFWAMHDLLHEYALEQAAGRPGLVGRDGRHARDRLLDAWLRTAAEAMDTAYPHERASRPTVPDPGVPRPAFAGPSDAVAWLDGQRANLVAAALRSPRHAVGLSRVLWRHLEAAGRHADALAIHTAAAEATRPGDEGYADVQANLGGLRWWEGEYEAARARFARSLAAHRASGDRAGQARALARLGPVLERLGDYPGAVAHLQEALALYRAGGQRHGEAAQLVNLGTLHRRLGRFEEAAGHQRQAAAIFAELGDRRLEGYALGNLGAVENLRGRPGEALPHLQAALALCREARDPGGEGSALAELGVALLGLGRAAEALERLEPALAILRRVGDRGSEAEVLNRLGHTHAALGRAPDARERYAEALALAGRSGDRYEQAVAHAGLGDLGDEGHRVRAEALLRELGVSPWPGRAARSR